MLTASSFQYDSKLRCDRCDRGSDLGFFYRCVHNVDARLFENMAEGNQVDKNKPLQYHHQRALTATLYY